MAREVNNGARRRADGYPTLTWHDKGNEPEPPRQDTGLFAVKRDACYLDMSWYY